MTERMYAAALYVYPIEMRRQYGDAMRQAFRDRCHEFEAAGRNSPIGFVWEILRDWFSSILYEHWTNESRGALRVTVDSILTIASIHLTAVRRPHMHVVKSAILVVLSSILLTAFGIAWGIQAELEPHGHAFSIHESLDVFWLGIALVGSVFGAWGGSELFAINSRLKDCSLEG